MANRERETSDRQNTNLQLSRITEMHFRRPDRKIRNDSEFRFIDYYGENDKFLFIEYGLNIVMCRSYHKLVL